MAAMAFGWTASAGWQPALYASTQPSPHMRANASAIWLRLQFSLQTKRTRFGCPELVMSLDPSTLFGLGGIHSVNGGLRAIGCPGEPPHLPALEPAEHPPSPDPPSGDVSAASRPQIDERCRFVLRIDGK